jgi:hypothetical protein
VELAVSGPFRKVHLKPNHGHKTKFAPLNLPIGARKPTLDLVGGVKVLQARIFRCSTPELLEINSFLGEVPVLWCSHSLGRHHVLALNIAPKLGPKDLSCQ